MSTLSLVMGVKKSNWLAPGMWVIINLHAASDWLMSGIPGFWLADGLLVWETNKNAYICVAQQCCCCVQPNTFWENLSLFFVT